MTRPLYNESDYGNTRSCDSHRSISTRCTTWLLYMWEMVSAQPPMTAPNQPLMRAIVNDLALSPTSPRHHLVHGCPGSGKTFLLNAAVEALGAGRRPPLVLQPLGLGVSSGGDLLVEALRGHVDISGHRVANNDSSARLRLEQAVVDTAAGRPILLVLDDIDVLFARLPRGDQLHLRMWTREAHVRVLASAQSLTPPLVRAPWPWRDAFDRTHLDMLTPDQAVEFVRNEARRSDRPHIANWAGSTTGLSELAEAYTRLGGTPRVWALVAHQLATATSVDSAISGVIDALAPYLLARLKSLPPGPARLILALARAQAPISVSDLAREVGIPVRQVATTLGRLKAASWVSVTTPAESAADRRRSFYTITDPALRECIRTLLGHPHSAGISPEPGTPECSA